jgi:predicted GTPase
MEFGAGVVAARAAGAAALLDPRPYAVGSLLETFAKYPHIGALLPAMGYSEHQLAELETTIRRAECDQVLIATPVDLARVIEIQQPSQRVRYEVEERSELKIAAVLREFVAAHREVRAARDAEHELMGAR